MKVCFVTACPLFAQLMATLKVATFPNPIILLRSSTKFPSETQNSRRVSLVLKRCGNGIFLGKLGVHCCSSSNGELGRCALLKEVEGQDGYLVRRFGWGVRRMAPVGDEMRRVAQVQAQAFHEPVLLFDNFFFQFFKGEVLSGLLYRIRNSAPDRYACLVAESITGPQVTEGVPELVGVADVTIQREEDVVKHIGGDQEYLYVSGIAVLIKFRRQKIATVLLEACDVMSRRWGFNYLVLRAYEDDSAAQKLYTKAGYRVVSGDPHWITLFGKKRRVLMIKH